MFFMIAFSVSAATLSLSPVSQTIAIGQAFAVDVILDSTGQPVDGVDLYRLRYNAPLLQVQSVVPGSLMPLTLANDSTVPGEIVFSQVVAAGTNFTGQGVLATINFFTLATGTADVTFDFTLGSTVDTNVAGLEIDLLTQVTNGSYDIVTPTPTPTGKFLIGDRVKVTQKTYVWSCPSNSCSPLGFQKKNTQGTVIGGPVSADGYNWWNIDYVSGRDGWSIENWLLKI